MKRTTKQLKQLVQTLPPKQQTLDFANSNLWRQWSAADRQACRDAIAALLYQVTLATQDDETQENNKHE
jgi:hypothetical protein